MLKKQRTKKQRSKKVRAKIKGVSNRLRLSVFRSNKHISLQIIDDNKGKTLVSFNDLELDKGKSRHKAGRTKTEIAKEVGKELAKKALDKKINEVVFDRGNYRYHGRVKATAEGVREGGLKF